MDKVKVTIDGKEFEMTKEEAQKASGSCKKGDTWCVGGNLLKCNSKGKWFDSGFDCD
ncbi:MAG: hypothetical protein AAF717_21350 [Bacteroidota bacterium]|nr:hypothetical protein [uncultured Allomuricauda sp.]